MEKKLESLGEEDVEVEPVTSDKIRITVKVPWGIDFDDNDMETVNSYLSGGAFKSDMLAAVGAGNYYLLRVDAVTVTVGSYIALAPPPTTARPSVDCMVSEYGPWSPCTVSCDGGTKTRRRSIVTQPQNDGKECPSLTEEGDCNMQACPVDCMVSRYGPWSQCSRSCDGGTETRERSILT